MTSAAAVPSPAPSSTGELLIIGPGADSYEALRRSLALVGWSSAVAQQLVAAMVALRRLPPNRGVLITGELPGIPLAVLVKALRGLPGFASLPVLLTFQVLEPPPGITYIGELSATTILAALKDLPPQDDLDWDSRQLDQIDRLQPGLKAEMAAAFLGELANVRCGLDPLLTAGNAEAVRQVVHKLKGSSASMGAIRLMKACAALEVAARAGDIAAMRAAQPELHASLLRVEQRMLQR